jgi:hypothetical protein
LYIRALLSYSPKMASTGMPYLEESYARDYKNVVQLSVLTEITLFKVLSKYDRAASFNQANYRTNRCNNN